MPLIIEGQKSIYSDKTIEFGNFVLDPSSDTSSLSNNFADAAGNHLKDAAVGRITKEASKILGPLSIVTGFITDKIGDHMQEERDNKASLKGIEEFSKKNVPGMMYKETNIDGDQYKIGVDASGKISFDDSEPRIIVERVDGPSFGSDDVGGRNSPRINLKEPTLATQISAMTNAANASVDAYKQDIAAKLPDEKKKYREDMTRYLDEVDEASINRVETLVAPVNPLGTGTRYAKMLSTTMDEKKYALLRNDADAAPIAISKSAPDPALSIQ